MKLTTGSTAHINTGLTALNGSVRLQNKMAAITQNNGFQFYAGRNIEMKRFNGFLLLFFVSAVVFAQAGITQLPETYRTPLSDMVYQDMKEWRAEPEDEYPWREDEEDLLIKPRIKVELFPQYNYDSLYYRDSIEDPISNSLFQNENEIERPVSNIFQYSF